MTKFKIPPIFPLIISFFITISIFSMDKAYASSLTIPDISEWQGKLSISQVRKLKKQVPFIINRRQYGIYRQDKFASSNTNLYQKFHIPFGEYDFSTFHSCQEAKSEARDFYYRSNKHTKFYVLDYEQNNMKYGNTNTAVSDWYKEMRKLTSKKLIFYSYQGFAIKYANHARKRFDGQWIANYTKKPTIKSDLWQYTDKKYIPALKQSVDASKITNSNKNVTWWIGNTTF
ncbi:lysin [Levilactobacillus brevis]|uniref:Lysin n=2 Tax=Levilactobacillus brevis TaxID=1580 RepID=A0AA41ES11_LEVBR|nr:lysin [Levilactobacillus brevis]MBS1007219.1 lysin [Levilactobacillus brevis]MBS1011808.1 lysin [Levilactobacillus brevis]MBS1014192.1 lysin [Levilactobacillus brevis]